MPVRKKSAVRRSYTRRAPEDVYGRLVDLNERTTTRLQELEQKYGFGSSMPDARAIEVEARIAPALAIGNTLDPAMTIATFIVPHAVAWEMVSTFTQYAAEKTAA